MFLLDPSSEIISFVNSGVFLEFDQKSYASFYTYQGGKGFFFATKDGISYRNEDGRILMSETFTMQNPKLYGEGKLAAVSEHSGYDIYMFNTQGLMYTKHFLNPIVNFSMSSQGYSSVVTKKDDSYETFVHNPTGTLISKGTYSESNMMITSSDISNDGRIWAISYLDINGAQINSKINFHYLNKSESTGLENSIFGSINDQKNQYFGILKFMEGNNLIVVSDKEISCINPNSNKIQTVWTLELNNEIDAIDFSSSYIAIALGKGFLNKEAEPAGRVILIDLEMNRIFEYDTEEKVTSLTCTNQAVIIGNGRNFTAINNKGIKIWSYSAVLDSKKMFFLDSTDKVLLQAGNTAEIMKLTKISATPAILLEEDELAN